MSTTRQNSFPVSGCHSLHLSLRYNLSKLRAKALVEKLPHSRRYRLLPEGYSICLVFLKLFERVYAPLTARPTPRLPANADRTSIVSISAVDDLDALINAVGLKAA